MTPASGTKWYNKLQERHVLSGFFFMSLLLKQINILSRVIFPNIHILVFAEYAVQPVNCKLFKGSKVQEPLQSQ